MPTDAQKLTRMLNELGLTLCKQSIERQEQETENINEIAKILTRISKVMGDTAGAQIQDLGKEFFEGCVTHAPFTGSPKKQTTKKSK
jgi:hypothetical protein